MQRPAFDPNARVSTCAVDDEAKARTASGARTQTARVPQPDPAVAANALTFYPAYTFDASLTWWKWVKLTCHDIHTVLKPHEKYQSVTTWRGTKQNEKTNTYMRSDPPLLLFYLNHPIQFVQVIGVVVAWEEYFEKFWLFTVDDSSGATIDVTCPKPAKEEPTQTLPTAVQSSKPTAQDQNKDENIIAEQILQTTLSNLTIGTVVQAKGSLTTFRSTRQLSLLRLTILPSTTHEMVLISSRSQFYSSTLTKPWVLSRTEERKLCLNAQDVRNEEVELARKRRKREQRRREREERHREIIEREYEREEKEREKEADKARRWGEDLKEKTNKRMKLNQV